MKIRSFAIWPAAAAMALLLGDGGAFRPATAQAQLDSSGLPQATSAFPVEHGVVNLNNGALHLEIPIVNYAQRGNVQLPATLNYDSNIWKINTSEFDKNWTVSTNTPSGQSTNGGWYFSYHPQNNSMSMIPAGPITCTGAIGSTYGVPYFPEIEIFPGITWVDDGGTSHIFPATIVPASCTGRDGNNYVQNLTASAYATDGSGYYAAVTYTRSDFLLNANIYDRSGSLVASNSLNTGNGSIYSSFGSSPGPALPVDRNGNSTTNNGSWIVDTMGRNLVSDSGVVNVAGVGTVEYITIPVAGGNTATYTINYKTINVATSFGDSGVIEGNASMLVVSSVVLPDKSSYTFQYNEGSFGEVKSMSLPHGATVSFSYATIAGLAGGPPTRAVSQHTGSEGITNFTLTQASTSSYSQAGTACGMVTNQVTTLSAGSNTYKFSNCSGNILLQEVDHGSASSSQIDAIDLYSYDTSNPCPTLGTVAVYNMGCVGPQWMNITGKTTVLPPVGGTGTSLVKDTQYSYAYPGTGIPTSVKQWDYYPGAPTTLPDSPPGLPTKEVDTTLGYNVNGALFPTEVDIKDSTGTVVGSTVYSYDDPTHMSSIPSGAPSHSNSLVTGNRGNLTRVSQCCGWNAVSNANVPLTTNIWYDDAGSVQKIQDARLNYTTLSSYDPTDTFPTTIQLPNTLSSSGAAVSHTITQTYDANSGLVSSVTDQNHQTTTYTFDQYGRPYQVLFSNAGNQVTLQTTTYPSARETDVSVLQSPGVYLSAASFLDTFGRPTQSTQGEITTEYTYDAQGRLYSVTNPHRSTPASTDGTVYYAHDELGRVTTVTLPTTQGPNATLSNLLATTYTYAQNTVTTTDPLQHQRQMVFDAFGNTTQVFEPDNTGALSLETDYQYNWQSKLIMVMQKGGTTDSTQWRERTFAYDGAGRLQSQTTPEAKMTSFTYDNNGNLLSTQNANAAPNTVHYVYDSLNRMQTATVDGGPTYTYTYDEQTDPYGQGLLTSVSMNGSGVGQQWQHDPLGRVVSTSYCLPSSCNWNVQSTYDFQGNQTSLTYPDGRRLQWSYDKFNRPMNVTYAAFGSTPVGTPYASNLSYTPGGQVQQATFGNGSGAIQFGATYDPNANLSSLLYVANNAPVVEKTYDWDKNASNLTSVTDFATGRKQVFAYDQLDRLSSFADSGNSTPNTCSVNLTAPVWTTSYPSTQSPQLAAQCYSLDAWGNLTFGSSGATSFQHTGGTDNRVASFASNYDTAGNLMNDGINTYNYRADGLMTGSNGWTYTYDALGQRVHKDNGASANEYIYYGGKILAMYNPATQTWTDRIYGPTGALATVPGTQSGAPIYRVSDHLGSLSYTLDASGTVTNTSSALPYGQVLGNTPGDAFPFTDHERDGENQTDATMYRHYSSMQGRWLSPDPSNGSYNLLDPQSLNRYAYVRNRPMNQVDHSGLDGTLTFYNGSSGDDGNNGDDDNGWDDIWDDIGSGFDNFFSFFGSLIGAGNGGSGSTPPWTQSISAIPSVASDGLPATTQPNGGGAYINATLWANPAQGTSGSFSNDVGPGLDFDGTSTGRFGSNKSIADNARCAAANASSLASLLGIPKSNFLGQALLGNDIATLSNIVFGPDRGTSVAQAGISSPLKYNLVSHIASNIGATDSGTGRWLKIGSLDEMGNPSAVFRGLRIAETAGGKALSEAFAVFTIGKLAFDTLSYGIEYARCAGWVQ